MNTVYEIKDMFGGRSLKIVEPQQKKSKTLFDDYEGFVDKFKPRLTTDDCYTPPAVYNCVLDYVRQYCDVEGCEIIRPFWPGMDYEKADYPSNCAVVDNPPFSIISRIVRFYIERNIRFFLFAPHLTLFSSNQDCTGIIAGARVVYENGADVRTSFLSNMFGNVKIIGCPELYMKVKDINDKGKLNLPVYRYPVNVLTISSIQWMVERGISISINKDEVLYCRRLDSQHKHGKAIFGNGFLLSGKAAKRKELAEIEAANVSKAAKESLVMEWELSAREIELIKSLDK